MLPAIVAGGCVISLGLGVGSASSVVNPSDQSRVGQRHGSFLKVFAWFMGFFTIAGIGGGIWWVLSRFAGQAATALVMLGVSITMARAILRWSGRRLERDPYGVMRKLDPRTS